MVIIPALVFVGGLYYASRGMSLLTTAFLGLITVEGRISKMNKEELEKDNKLGINPEYEKFLMASELDNIQKMRKLGFPAEDAEKRLAERPPTLQYLKVFFETRHLAPPMRWLAGNWLLSIPEYVQLLDVFRNMNLRYEFGEGEIFAKICREAELDPRELRVLAEPHSDVQRVDLKWLKQLSDNRLSDPEFASRFQRQKAK